MSRIAGLTVAQHSQLKKILSYKVDVRWGSSFQKRDATLLTKRGEFPTGLLNLVRIWLDNGSGWSLNDTRRVPNPLASFPPLRPTHPPYPEQEAIVEAARAYGRGSVSACTGFGKSYTMALLVASLRVKTLIVVPNCTLRDQLRADMLAYFGHTPLITVENIDSPTLEVAGDYDMILIDEGHHAAAATYRRLNKKVWNSIYYRFFFSATCFRTNEDEQLLYESIAGQVIYRIDYKEARDKGYVVPVEAYYITVPQARTGAFAWAGVYKDLVTHNDTRNDLIGRLLTALNAQNTPTLCLVKEVAHGNELLLRDASEGYFYFAHGQNDDTPHLIALFNRGTLKALIGTEGVLSEGVDTKPCEYVIIAGLGKSKGAFMQKVGRAVRKYPGKESAKVIIFKDNSHKWTKAHFAAQKKILQDEYNITPVEIKLT